MSLAHARSCMGECGRLHTHSKCGWVFVQKDGAVIGAKCWSCSGSKEEDPVVAFLERGGYSAGPACYSLDEALLIILLVEDEPHATWEARLVSAGGAPGDTPVGLHLRCSPGHMRANWRSLGHSPTPLPNPPPSPLFRKSART